MNRPLDTLTIDPFIFADLMAEDATPFVGIFRTWMGKNGGQQKEMTGYPTVAEARTKLAYWATDLFTVSLQTVVGWWDVDANEPREYRADIGLSGNVTFREHCYVTRHDDRYTGYPIYQPATTATGESIA